MKKRDDYDRALKYFNNCGEVSKDCIFCLSLIHPNAYSYCYVYQFIKVWICRHVLNF
jgi:hypothetical protein